MLALPFPQKLVPQSKRGDNCMLHENTNTYILPLGLLCVHYAGILSSLHVLAILHSSDTHDLQDRDNTLCRTTTMMACLLVQLFLERTSPHMLPAASSIFFTLDRRMDGEVRYKVRCPSVLHLLQPITYRHCWSSLTCIQTPGTSRGCRYISHCQYVTNVRTGSQSCDTM